MEGRWGVADGLAADEELARPSRLVFGLFVSVIVLLFLSVAVARPAHAVGNDEGVAVTRLSDDEDDEGEDGDDDSGSGSGSGSGGDQDAATEGSGGSDDGSGNHDDVQDQQQAHDSNDSKDSGDNVQAAKDSNDTDSSGDDVQGAADSHSDSGGTDSGSDSGNDVQGEGTDTNTSAGGDDAAAGNDQRPQSPDDVLGNVNNPAGPGGVGPDVLGTRFNSGRGGQGPAVAPAVQGAAEVRGQQLPFTGAQIAGLLAAAAGFVTSGLVLARKRRRQ